MTGQARQGTRHPTPGLPPRVLAWLIRPQYSPLVVAAAFVVGNLAFFNLVWWGNVIAGCSIGAVYGLLSFVLIPWLLRRKATP